MDVFCGAAVTDMQKTSVFIHPCVPRPSFLPVGPVSDSGLRGDDVAVRDSPGD